jgi:hypothetical protein
MELPSLQLSILSLIIFAALTSGEPASLDIPHVQRDEACGFDSNSDLYGLGIRLGIYMQWISSFIMYGWYPEGREGLTKSYIVFLFAILAVIIVQTLQASPVYAVEILLLTYFIFGGAWAVTAVGARRSHFERMKRAGRLRTMSVTLILTAAAVYCSWFWLRGIHFEQNFHHTPCGTYTFFFARIPFYHKHITKFFAALSIMGAVGWGYLAVLVAGILLYAVTRSSSRRDSEWVALANVMLEAAMNRDPQRVLREEDLPLRSSFREFIMGMLVSIYSVIAVEHTLYWNGVRDVYTVKTVGQLLPFVIGLVGLTKCVYKATQGVRITSL